MLRVEDGIPIFEVDCGSMLVSFCGIRYSIAAKQPTPDQIAACEANYREIYRQEGEDIKVEFPKHYPTSALIGYVDVVDVLPSSQLRECNIPDTVRCLLVFVMDRWLRKSVALRLCFYVRIITSLSPLCLICRD